MLTRSSRVLLVALLSWMMTGYASCLAQAPVSAGSVNTVLNPLSFSGSDIGAQINTAWKSGLGKTVLVPPGTYSFSTTIALPGDGYALECDAGATLNYTGSSDAILLPYQNQISIGNSGVDGRGGCLLQGTSAAQSGIHILAAINGARIRNMRISGFTEGYGIYDTGGNTVTIAQSHITGNRTGVYLTGSPYGSAYAADGIHI
jgi:nitrous oxidase accessory protein NosD